MSDRSRDLDDAGKPGQRAGNREGKENQIVGIESGKARRSWRGADQPDFKSHDHAPKQHSRQHDDDERHDGAGVQPPAFDQGRHRRDRIEFGGGGEIHAVRIAPRPAHQIVHAEIGDIDQHQTGEDFAGAETHPANRRDQRVERAADRAQEQHGRQHPMAGVGAVGAHGEPAAADGADDELALGADIPDIGDVTERQADRDHHQRRRLDGDLLQRKGSVSGSMK